MRNTWLIIQREYMERVRTKSFLVLTLLAPAIMTALMVLPAKLATMGENAQHIVVVTSTPQFGEMVRQQLLSPGHSANGKDDDDDENGSQSSAAKPFSRNQYVIDVDSNPTDAERASLRDKVNSKAIDGYLWLSDDAIAAGKITFATRSLANSGERARLQRRVEPDDST